MTKNSYDVNNNGSMSLSELAKLVAHLLQVVGPHLFVRGRSGRFLIFLISTCFRWLDNDVAIPANHLSQILDF